MIIRNSTTIFTKGSIDVVTRKFLEEIAVLIDKDKE